MRCFSSGTDYLRSCLLAFVGAVVVKYRAVTSKSGWEKELESVAEVVRTASHLVETHRLAEATHADWYSCKMLLASALRKVKGLFENSDECIKLNQLVQEVESYCTPANQSTS